MYVYNMYLVCKSSHGKLLRFFPPVYSVGFVSAACFHHSSRDRPLTLSLSPLLHVYFETRSNVLSSSVDGFYNYKK